MTTEKQSYTSGSIEKVFPCKCQHISSSITMIMVFLFYFSMVIIISLMHRMLNFCLTDVAIRRGERFTAFNGQTLKVTMLTVHLYQSKFSLGFVADLPNSLVKIPTSLEQAVRSSAWRAMGSGRMVCICGYFAQRLISISNFLGYDFSLSITRWGVSLTYNWIHPP